MRLDLQQFARAFRSEAVLHHCLATLLNKMPGNEAVTITHSTQEYGKDLIFYSHDGVGDLILNACVVKNAKITGSADSKGARNVLFQVEQALDTPFVSSAGETQNVARVYVVSPYDCSPETMHSIAGKLKQRSGQIAFLCGRRLLEKFAKWWPEFLIFEAALLSTYVSTLQTGLDHDHSVAFLLARHDLAQGDNKILSEIYVRQDFTKHFCTIILLVPVLDILNFNQLLHHKHFDEVARSLELAASLLGNAQAWESGDYDTARKYSSELTALVHSLKAQRTREKNRDTVSASVDAAYTIPLLSEASKAIECLKQRVSRANSFALSNPMMPAMASSEEFLNYCRVHELVTALPHCFLVETSIQFATPIRSDLLDSIHGPLLITAPMGFGKTSFCKWSVLADVKKLASGESRTIPVYVPMHQLSTVLITNYREMFFRTGELRDLIDRAKKDKRQIRLYLDGLDEVTTTEQQQKLMALAETMSGNLLNVQVIVTSRDYVTGPSLRWLARVNLAMLNDSQVDELIANWLGGDFEAVADFKKQMTQSRPLKPLMNIPLLATLIVAVYRRRKSLPDNKVKLYEIFTELMCGEWDLIKNIRRESNFSSKVKMSILTRLAGVLHHAGKIEATEKDLKEATSTLYTTNNSQSLIDECLGDGLLIRTMTGFAFSHLSFQEFLAAKDLADPLEGLPTQILIRFLKGDDRWREVLSFYVALSNRPNEVAVWLKNQRWRDQSYRIAFLLKCLAESSPNWVDAQSYL